MSDLTVASAQQTPPSSSPVPAQALYNQGMALKQQGKIAQAAKKFQQSQVLDPALGTQWQLALCYEDPQMEKYASAWWHFREVECAAKIAGHAQAQSQALSKAAAVEPYIAVMSIRAVPQPDAEKIEIQCTTKPPSVTVPSSVSSCRQKSVIRCDGQWARLPAGGATILADQGTHVLRVRAPGKSLWTAPDININAKGQDVEIEIPELGSLSPPAPKQPSPRPNPVAMDRAETPSAQSWSALGIAALGVVGLGVGTAFAVWAKNDADASNEFCMPNDTNACSEPGVELRDEAIDRGNVATGLFIGSGVALGGALALWLSAPDGPVRDGAFTIGPRGRVRVALDPTLLGLTAKW